MLPEFSCSGQYISVPKIKYGGENYYEFSEAMDIKAGCQLDFVKKKVFLKGLIFKKKGFATKKKGFPCQMDSFLIPAKGFFTSCILK